MYTFCIAHYIWKDFLRIVYTILSLQYYIDLQDKMKKEIVGFVFCGGRGTRLMPYTEDIPKPILLKQNGKSFLEINIDSLLKLGAREVYVNYSYGRELFEEIASKYNGILHLIEENEPVGHAKTISSILNKISDSEYIYTINGDTIAQLDRELYLNQTIENNTDFSILSGLETPIEKNLLIDSENNVIGCKSKDQTHLYYNTQGENTSYANSLGEYIIKIPTLRAVDPEVRIQDFVGFFGNNDLLEIMANHNYKIKIFKQKIDSYTSINTIEEYNNFMNNINA